MPIEVLMPALSPTMTEGNLAKWVKQEGDQVESGDVIAEIETDKATMEVEAVDEGVMGKILVAEGTEGVAVNQPIALLLEEDEDKSVLDSYEVSTAPAATSEVNEEEVILSETKDLNQTTQDTSGTSSLSMTGNSNHRIFASPLARRVAEQGGVDIAHIQGTGPHGRIIKADVEDALANGIGSATGSSFAAVVRNPQEYSEIPNNNMRKTIAKRLQESKQNVPHFYLSIDCELDRLLDARKQINGMGETSKETPPRWKVSVNDMIIRAVALGLRDIPAANASWTDAVIQRYNNVDVSVAVALQDGLITPIVKNADQKSVVQISAETKDLIKRARDGKLQPEEFQGGGFSISNLGMYGIKQFNAIINPPQGCILAVGAGEERVVSKNGQFTTVNVMTVTLSCDHRVVDGAVGAEFLAAFKTYIEEPVRMLI